MDNLQEKKEPGIGSAQPVFEFEPSREAPPPAASGSEVAPAISEQAVISSPLPAITPDKPTKSALEVSIENVLEEDLDQVFWKLQPAEQANFKTQGEETATRIRDLLGQAVVKVQDVFGLILGWLKNLPGVSKFFIEQEAKIKTDKIMSLKK